MGNSCKPYLELPMKDDLTCGSCNHFTACPPHSVIVSSHTEGIQL